jgi:uncharacterized protein
VSLTIGVISDTHGLMRPEALDALAGVDHIVHAGDIGGPEILAALRAIAPLTAVRGNNDRGAWTTNAALADTEVVTVGGQILYVLHDLAELDLDPAVSGFAAVITGHSHKPAIRHERGVLYFNPGSAGPRRFHLPIALGRLRVDAGGLHAEHVLLEPRERS